MVQSAVSTENCFSGSIIQLTYPQGLLQHLRANHILLKDFKEYAISLAEELKENAKNLAKKNNAPYIYLKDSKHSNEKIVKEIINQRGEQPGLVAVITNLEVEYGFDIQGNKTEKKIELSRRDSYGKSQKKKMSSYLLLFY